MTASIPVLVVNDTRVDYHHGCSSVMVALERLMQDHGMEPVALWPAHADWRGDAGFDAALNRARLLIVNGEGSMHHDRPAGRRLLEIGALARERGVPAALINAGWEANSADLTAMLRDFAVVSARDSQSAAAMGDAPADLRVVPDLSFCSVPQPQPATRAARSAIGFTDNVDRMKSLVLDRARRACDGQVISIHQGGERGYTGFLREGLSLRSDMRNPGQALALLRMRHDLWEGRTGDTGVFLNQLTGLRLLVSGRFHACTLALAVGTPFIAQASNTGKIAALARDAGLAPWRCEIGLDPEDIRAAADRGWSTEEDRNRAAYVADAHPRAAALFDDLRRLAG